MHRFSALFLGKHYLAPKLKYQLCAFIHLGEQIESKRICQTG